MELLNIIAILITLAAVFSYLNYRYIGLPTTIGVMVIAMAASLLVIIAGALGVQSVHYAKDLVQSIDFTEALMQGMLSFLLFAGALHVNINDLAKQKWLILTLATGGVLISSLLLAIAAWYIFAWLGISLPFVYCLLFGALISPTDPIAVMGILKTAGVSKSLEIKIAGESLFNDGVAVVVFLVLLGIAVGGHEVSAAEIGLLFLQEAVGGALFGLLLGYLGYLMLRSIDQYQVEVLITLALVMGGYALADALHISGPLAMVVAGLLVGNHGRRLGMSDKSREHIDQFWHLIDEVLNTVLFLLIGLELLALKVSAEFLIAAALMIPAALLARFISVGTLVGAMRPLRTFSPGVVKILTWGGLRGGISVALVLSLPAGPERSLLLTLTYIVVVFSILVQGLTIERLARSIRQS